MWRREETWSWGSRVKCRGWSNPAVHWGFRWACVSPRQASQAAALSMLNSLDWKRNCFFPSSCGQAGMLFGDLLNLPVILLAFKICNKCLTNVSFCVGQNNVSINFCGPHFVSWYPRHSCVTQQCQSPSC